MEPLLAARRVLREKFAKLHRKVLLLARDNEVCQRLMTIPGVGPVVSRPSNPHRNHCHNADRFRLRGPPSGEHKDLSWPDGTRYDTTTSKQPAQLV